jgi:hypothetical protein
MCFVCAAVMYCLNSYLQGPYISLCTCSTLTCGSTPAFPDLYCHHALLPLIFRRGPATLCMCSTLTCGSTTFKCTNLYCRHVMHLQGPSNIVHVRYADLWQYNPGADGRLSHRHFMATAWAGVWPVFVPVAAQHTSKIPTQVRHRMLC